MDVLDNINELEKVHERIESNRPRRNVKSEFGTEEEKMSWKVNNIVEWILKYYMVSVEEAERLAKKWLDLEQREINRIKRSLPKFDWTYTLPITIKDFMDYKEYLPNGKT